MSCATCPSTSTPSSTRPPPTDARLKVTAHLDIRQLPLRKQDDRNRDDVTLVCALFDGNGNYLKGTQKVVELRLKDENLEQPARPSASP